MAEQLDDNEREELESLRVENNELKKERAILITFLNTVKWHTEKTEKMVGKHL
jgi:hypothetical protein